MKKDKRVYLVETSTDFQEINKAIAVLAEKLPAYLEEISSDEKQRSTKMKDKSFAFVQKAFEHSATNPIIVPSFVDTEAFKAEMDAMELFRQLLTPLKKLTKGIEDTQFTIASDAYNAALAIYGQVKVAAKNNVTGAQVIYEDLKVRFDKKTMKKEPTPNKAA